MIKTERLILRAWRETDFEAFAKINADPRVMEFFPGTLTTENSDLLANRICSHINEHKWGLWAVSVPNVSDFIGFIGLNTVPFITDFTPAVEVGWRLAYDFWNKGYATEGAQAAIKYGFETLLLDEIVSFTAAQNTRSQNVMKKIGMRHNSVDDFDHPKLAEGHWLRRHVLYRLSRKDYCTQVWENLPNDFKPVCEVVACYVEIEGKLLLLEYAQHAHESKTWGVPAGKMELGETPLQAARRELAEETGIVVSNAEIAEIGKLYIQKQQGDYIYHMFQVHINTLPSICLSLEHSQYLWVSIPDIGRMPLISGAKQTLPYYARWKSVNKI